jgi:hypothetical protein
MSVFVQFKTKFNTNAKHKNLQCTVSQTFARWESNYCIKKDATKPTAAFGCFFLEAIQENLHLLKPGGFFTYNQF